MDKEALDQASAEAWKDVLAHPNADLKNYLIAMGTQFKGNAKPAATSCPFCGGKKFGLYKKGDDWQFKCFSNTCQSGGETGGISKFVELHSSVDWKGARKILHEVTGIPDPWQIAKDEAGKKKTERSAPAEPVKPIDDKPEEIGPMGPISPISEAPVGNLVDDEEEEELAYEAGSSSDSQPSTLNSQQSTEEDAPKFLRVPETGKNCYEAFWAEMTLTAAHRQELKVKRGADDGWITALGFKTAMRGNKAKLEPLLKNFPEKELLKTGLAQRDNYTRELRVAGMLCGDLWDEKEKRGYYEEIIIIPYIDAVGRIIGLRPHKRGLTTRDYRKEEVSEFYNKNHENLRIVYGENFLMDRPKEFEHTALIVEGEFKGVATNICGIPSIGFQGIQYFDQNKDSSQAIRDTVELLRRHKVREVIVVFDNEAKLDKPFAERFEAEVWARFTAMVLEDHGIKALFGVLPDSWRDEKGKADWDGRLAWHVRQARTHAAGVKAATTEFLKFLRNRKEHIQRPPRQMRWDADLKEDIIMQRLNKLRHVPKIFIGGANELDTAAELTNWCHPKYVDRLSISKLTDALRETYGGYYKPKPPSEALEKRALEVVGEIDAVLKKHDEEVNLSETELRQYRAARKACMITLYRYPKTFTDFTAKSEYKVLCHEPDGSTRLDRLIVFKDKNGRQSRSIQMAGDKLNSSQELRKFFPKVGSYHWWGNQEECDFWLQELDVQNYQRTITEIDTYGWNREVGLYIMGDCAIGKNGHFIFPDRHGIIWYNNLGYKNSEGVEAGTAFCHKPPLLFPEEDNPRKAHDAIDWGQEQGEGTAIWETMQQDFTDAFGGMGGLACLGGMLQYLAHPETLSKLSGKPGLWVQGRKGSGKTKTVEAGMRIYGFPRIYEIVALGSTKVGIERNLSQFSGLPVHIDEWRNARADDNTVGFITNGYNEIGISKGTSVGSKSTRKSRAATMPIVTGEDGATDPALRSRYLRLIMSKSQRQGTTQEQRRRYFKMIENADMYYRVGRLIFKNRDKFAARLVELTQELLKSPKVTERISGDREQEVMAICFAAVIAAHEILDPARTLHPKQNEFFEFMLKHGAESCDEITGDIFMVNFFADAVNMIKKSVPHVDKYLRVCRGSVDTDTGKVTIIPDITSDKGRVLVFVAYRELYDVFKEDQGKMRQSASIARANIQAELKAEDAYVKLKIRPGVHNYRLPGKSAGTRDESRNYWVLDFEKCPPELKDVFRPIYERTLNEEHYELTDDDTVVHESDFKPGF